MDSLFTWAFRFSIGNVKISDHNCSFIYLSVVGWYALQWSQGDRVTPVTLCSGNVCPLSLSCFLSLGHTTQLLKVFSKKLFTGFGVVPERPANHYPWLNAGPRSLTGGNVLWGTLLGQSTKLEYGWYVRERYCTSARFPEVNSFTKKIISQIPRKRTWKYLRVNGHDV